MERDARTHNTKTTYLWAATIPKLFEMLHEFISDEIANGESLEDLIIGDFTQFKPVKLGDKMIPIPSLPGEMFVYGITYTI